MSVPERITACTNYSLRSLFAARLDVSGNVLELFGFGALRESVPD
jgi:hypothetical protein